MADNVAITGGAYTATVAADDIGGVHYQRAKLVWGPDGTANDADVATGKPLPIQLRAADGTDLSVTDQAVAFDVPSVVTLLKGMVGNNTVAGTTVYGLPAFAVRNPTAPDGDNKVGAIPLSTLGAVKVAQTEGAVATDDAAFTVGTAKGAPVGGTYRVTLDAVDDGDFGAFAMTSRRALYVSHLTPNGDALVDDTAGIDALQVTLMTMPQVIGSVAHDSPDTQPPVKVGGYASAALRAAVGEGDRVDASWDLKGRLRAVVHEMAAGGTTSIAQVTVDDSTTNGVQLIAANSAGTRRRVVVTNHSTTPVYINTGNLTAGGTAAGEILAGVVGAEKSYFTVNTLRATVDTGTAVVAVREEVLA